MELALIMYVYNNDYHARFILTKLVINVLNENYFSSGKDTTNYQILKESTLKPLYKRLIFSLVIGDFNFLRLNLLLNHILVLYIKIF